ncbi:hypothetical protein HHO41_14885 [Bacillus sp. DNRA2]|uniref:hypothetical protein n=1 Tax=Bacillus sp. DNRA2 TaxID=2723053 RepID=UPI00145D614C|nr:hypothetical protein [Bacillus sp. DNRA2]NMD71586.1 hypothetical protein [Bacillus sp. DNRA2]
MFRKLTEEDFAVLRGPFESERQSPTLMGAALFLSIFLQGLLWYLEYHFMDYTTYPNAKEIVTYHFWFTAVLIVLSLIYSVPAVFNRSQKIQYLIVILVSQNFGAVSEYILGVFLLAEGYYERPEVMLNTFTNVTLFFGALIFIVTFVRFYLLLAKGEFRKGSKRDFFRGDLEAGIKSNLSSIIVGSTGLVFIIQFLARNVQEIDLDLIMSVVLPILLFFTMMFVLPEQLVILFCKYRFKSFNYDKNGYLLSKELDAEGKLNHGN